MFLSVFESQSEKSFEMVQNEEAININLCGNFLILFSINAKILFKYLSNKKTVIRENEMA